MRDWRDGCGVSIGTGQTGGNLDGFFAGKIEENDGFGLFGTLHRAFGAKLSGNFRIFYIVSISGVKKIIHWRKNSILKDFAGKFGTHFFHIFRGGPDTK